MTTQPASTLNGIGFAQRMLADDRAAAAMGIKLVRCETGSATQAMTVTESRVNGHDIAHGGFVLHWPIPRSRWRATVMAARRSLPARRSCSSSRRRSAMRWSPRPNGSGGVAAVYDVTVRCGGSVVAEFRGNSRALNSAR
jgi:acyl-CoA thioesterase